MVCAASESSDWQLGVKQLLQYDVEEVLQNKIPRYECSLCSSQSQSGGSSGELEISDLKIPVLFSVAAWQQQTSARARNALA